MQKEVDVIPHENEHHLVALISGSSSAAKIMTCCNILNHSEMVRSKNFSEKCSHQR